MLPKVKISHLYLKNPVLCASGTFGYGEEFKRFFDINILGGFVTKTITLYPRKGNPHPRIYDLGFGVINSVGLENPGLKEFKEKYIEFFRGLQTAVFVSIYGRNIKEWRKLIEELDREPIAGFELNFSCPNIKEKIISCDRKRVFKIVSILRRITNKLLIPKLSFSPFIVEVSLASQDAGADALTLINTLPAMVLNPETRKPVLGNVFGGLSGPCIKPVALRCVYEVASKVKIPVIGCGGIKDFNDVLEFLECGAKAVQIGSINLVHPDAAVKIIKSLEGYYAEKKY